MSYLLTTPVVLIVYRRPRETADLMAILERVRPQRLYVVADAPRTSAEKDACANALRIARRPTWSCEVEVDLAECNLGCRKRISSGLDKVFAQEEAAIILEDDLLPSPTFFQFASELLDHYRDDTRVMHVGGINHQGGVRRSTASYTFSKHTHCWGWATWRRAWRHYDHKMETWPAFREGGYLERVCPDPLEREYFRRILDEVAVGKLDSWAYVWTYSCWKENGLGINPESNLVANQGFGENATHTHQPVSLSALSATDIEFPLKHPDIMAPCEVADRHTFYHQFEGNEILAARSVAGRIRQTLRGAARRLRRWS